MKPDRQGITPSGAITFSVVSHGQIHLVETLLAQFDASPTLRRAKVVVTLNLADEFFDPGRFPNLDCIVLRNARPKGFGSNHNQAFRHCGTPWFAVLNPDLRLAAQEPFTQLLERAQLLPCPGALAPRVVNSEGLPEDSVRGNLSPWSLIRRHMLGHRTLPPRGEMSHRGRAFYWLAGMCLLLDAKAFRAVGGFDERYFLYCEDYDLCARLYNAGYTLLCDAEGTIIHDAQRGSRRSARYLYWHVASLLRMWTSPPYWRLLMTAGGRSPKRMLKKRC